MARICACCAHHQRAEIDAALIAGTPLRTIAERFDLRHAAIGRHAQNHLTAHIRAAAEAHAIAPSASELQPVAPRPARAIQIDDGPPPTGVMPPQAPESARAVQNAAALVPVPVAPLDPYQLACELRDSAVNILREAAASGDAKLALEANRTATAVLDRLARLMPASSLTGAAMPLAQCAEWLALRATLIAALAPFPDARAAVANALAELEVAP